MTHKSSIFYLYANHSSLGSLGRVVVMIVLASSWSVISASYLKRPKHY